LIYGVTFFVWVTFVYFFFTERLILTHGNVFAEPPYEQNSAKKLLLAGPMVTRFTDSWHTTKPLPSVLVPLLSVFGTWQTLFFP
jgi:hypothetical protein